MSALPKSDRRTKLIRLVHVAKRELKLSDENYRALLTRETKKDSCAEMNEAELDRVLKCLRGNGFRVKRPQAAPARTGRQRQLRDGQAALITALWIDLWELGAVNNPDDKAIDAFVKRQTGVDHFRWLTAQKAKSVIEALKSWCGREGFDIPAAADEEVPGLAAKRALCEAIYAKLDDESRSAFEDDVFHIHAAPAYDAEKLAARMGYRLRDLKAERK